MTYDDVHGYSACLRSMSASSMALVCGNMGVKTRASKCLVWATDVECLSGRVAASI